MTLVISILVNLICSFLPNSEQALVTSKVTINEGWMFAKGSKSTEDLVSWEKISIPHTWNKEDPFDDVPGYYRGWGTYKKTFKAEKKDDVKYFLYFEGVNQIAQVSLNGKKVGEHAGGYTGFAFDITNNMIDGPNELIVEVNNEHDSNVPPLKGDFNFYGGIYRDVFLVSTGQVYFDKLDYGSPGVTYDYTVNENGSLTANVKAKVKGTLSKTLCELVVRLNDKTGKEVYKASKKIKSEGIASTELKLTTFNKWSITDPYLYTLTTELITTEGTISDKVSIPVGFRKTRFDAEKGFFINDQPIKLLGVNRHQDYKGLGSALPNDLHISDLEMIKSLGANFLRTAHYPQDPAVLEACDRLGIVVSMEIPIDHDMTDSELFRNTTKEMMREMIRQNRNHPSIVLWAYMNEMFLGKNLTRDKKYIDTVVAFAKELNTVAKEEDPYRSTMVANHGDMQVYTASGMTAIPDVVGWNLYYGWYEADCNDMGKFLDSFHKDHPDKPIVITEFGAGSDPRIHSLAPQRFDFSTEWQSLYYLCNYPQIIDRPFVSGAAVWNMFDFGAEQRVDAIPHINKKGLCTFDRKPKDAFYVVQSFLSEQSILKILPSSWNQRTIEGKEKLMPIQVIGNIAKAELFHNEKSLEQKDFVGNAATWNVTLTTGANHIRVKSADGNLVNSQTILVESVKSEHMAVNMGTEFYFDDPISSIHWLPERKFENNSWGFVGGKVFMPRNRGFGTDRSISGTDNEPLFQTMRMGLNRFQTEVHPGTYQVTLHFTEPDANPGERAFDVLINKKLIWPNLDIASTVGRLYAMSLSTEVEAHSNIIVEFIPKKGETLLCGIQIEKKW